MSNRTFWPSRPLRNRPGQTSALTPDWHVLAAWEVDSQATGTLGTIWHVAAAVTADVDTGATGQLKLTSTATGILDIIEVDESTIETRLGFGEINNDPQTITVEGRSTSAVGGVRIRRAAITTITDPPAGLITDGTLPPGAACQGEFRRPVPMPLITPGPGGVVRLVADETGWDAAEAAAQPGDVILITADPNITINDKLGWGTPGVPGNHITITSTPGVVIPIRSLITADHVDMIGLTFSVSAGDPGFPERGAAIQILGTANSVASPQVISHNTVLGPGAADSSGVALRANPIAQNILILDNAITGTETGIHLGIQESPDPGDITGITIARNEIRDCNGNGIWTAADTTDVVIEDNLIVGVHAAPSATAHGGIAVWEPHTSGVTHSETIVRANRIIDVGAVPAIAIGGSSTVVESNLVWGCGPAVLVAVSSPSPDVLVVGNTLIGAVSPISGAVEAAENVGDSGLVDLAADFVGPLLGEAVAGGYGGGMAGAGSGFMLRVGSQFNGLPGAAEVLLMVECPGTPTHFGALPQENQ